MKNTKKLLELLAGKRRPQNADNAACVLQALLSDKTAKQVLLEETSRMALSRPLLVGDLIHCFSDAAEVATAIMALMISRPDELREIVKHYILPRIQEGDCNKFVERHFIEGSVLGFMEAVVWLSENQDPSDFSESTPRLLATIFADILSTIGEEEYSLSDRSSGEMTNLMKRFIALIDVPYFCKMLHARVSDKEESYIVGQVADDLMIKWFMMSKALSQRLKSVADMAT